MSAFAASSGELQDPIEKLDLSVRTYNCLKRASITTVADLLALTKAQLLAIRNLGTPGYAEARRKLNELGYMSEAQPMGPYIE